MGKGAQTREAILDEATRIASRVGLQGLTIGTLASQTQLSKSGLFAHFRSKEALQLEVLDHARQRFIDHVVRPALAAPRGEARVRELFEHWLGWSTGEALPGGCLFMAAATELDDQPGPVRDRLVADQRDWIDTVTRVFRTAIETGEFRADASPEQFAQDVYGVILAFNHAYRLLGDPHAEERARRAFEALLTAVRRPAARRPAARRPTAQRGKPRAARTA